MLPLAHVRGWGLAWVGVDASIGVYRSCLGGGGAQREWGWREGFHHHEDDNDDDTETHTKLQGRPSLQPRATKKTKQNLSRTFLCFLAGNSLFLQSKPGIDLGLNLVRAMNQIEWAQFLCSVSNREIQFELSMDCSDNSCVVFSISFWEEARKYQI